MGVLQGSVTSPILYCAFLDDISQYVPHQNVLPSSIFLYADDIAIVTDTAEEMQTTLNGLCEYSVINNFRFAATKCEVICSDDAYEDVGMYGVSVQRCSTFSYLGIIFDERGINSKLHIDRLVGKATAALHIDRLVGRATAALHLVQSIGANSRGFPDSLLRSLYIAFVRSSAEYGLAIL